MWIQNNQIKLCYPCSGPNLEDSDDSTNGDGGDGGDDEGFGGSGDRPGPSHRPPSSSVMKKTAQQIAGEAVLTRVVQAVEGVSFSFL